MDAEPYLISLKLAVWTTLLSLPLGLVLGRWLVYSNSRLRPWVEALILLPLVLPPTVIGYYLLRTLSPAAPVGQWLSSWLPVPLVFSFPGLVLASLIVNLPFVSQPITQACRAMPDEVREAAWVSGLGPWQTFQRVELPLIWPGIVAAAMLVFSHTLGEFGVVLLVGGNIDGVTRTLSIAIYDSVQAFDFDTAGLYSLSLLIFSLVALAGVRLLAQRDSAVDRKRRPDAA